MSPTRQTVHISLRHIQSLILCTSNWHFFVFHGRIRIPFNVQKLYAQTRSACYLSDNLACNLRRSQRDNSFEALNNLFDPGTKSKSDKIKTKKNSVQDYVENTGFFFPRRTRPYDHEICYSVQIEMIY